MRLAPLILVALSACVTTTTPQSEYDRHAPDIMAYVAEETGLPAGPLPKPVFTPQLADGAGLYDPAHNVILLPADWSPDVAGQETVAHEFTHVVQHHARPDIYKRQVERNKAMMAGHRDKIDEWFDSAMQICMDRERQAHVIAYRYARTLDPDYWADHLGPITIEEAAEMHAHGSCEPVRTARKLIDP